MNVSSSYANRSGYIGFLPGFKEIRWGKDLWAGQVDKASEQNAADKTETDLAPNAPGRYDPNDTFERREMTQSQHNEIAARLAEKYDPSNMTQEEYDSFLDDLVEEGILSKNQLGQLGYHGMMVVGSLAEGGTGMNYFGASVADSNNPDWSTYFSRYGFAFTLQDTKGDALAYAKLMSLWKPAAGPDGWLNFAEKQCDSFSVMANILEAMQCQRKD